MRGFLQKALLSLLVLFAGNQASAEGEVYFMGFNSLKVENKDQHKQTFDAYIKKLNPILERYSITTKVYDVVHGGEGDIKADIVTFGSATDQESFQAFFQDPEFHQIFPMLLGALQEHQVVFTAEPFEPDANAIPGHISLVLNWFKGDAVKARQDLDGIFDELKPLNAKYGIRKIAFSTGVYSNKGFGAEMKDTTPPPFVELWSMRDAHEFLSDETAKKSFAKLPNILEHYEAYWLRERVIH